MVSRASGMSDGSSFFYPVFKIILGVVCVILGVEYAWAYVVLKAASFGILYVADAFTWLCAGTILFTEGLHTYIVTLKRSAREAMVEPVAAEVTRRRGE